MDTKTVSWQPGVLLRGSQLYGDVPKVILFLLALLKNLFKLQVTTS